MNKITEIWFDDKFIFGKGDDGKVYKQSLLWYDRLRNASPSERKKYEFGLTGIHWRELDEDISFESFTYDEAVPSPLQEFFLTHKEINVGEFAKSMGMNPTLMRNYVRGWKKPSEARENEILDHIHLLGTNYARQSFSQSRLNESEAPTYGGDNSVAYEMGYEAGVKKERERICALLAKAGVDISDMGI